MICEGKMSFRTTLAKLFGLYVVRGEAPKQDGTPTVLKHSRRPDLLAALGLPEDQQKPKVDPTIYCP